MIRYAAGYVIRSLLKKFGRSSHVLKQEILLCLNELSDTTSKVIIYILLMKYVHVGSIAMDSEDHMDWTNSIDWGGLIHIL